MRTRLAWILVVFCLGVSEALALDAPKLQSLDQYTRIQIPSLAGSTFRVVSGSGEETVLVLTRVRPGSLKSLQGWSDSRVGSVQVSEQGVDTAEIRVRFRKPGTESFAYLQGDALVLDLWKQEDGGAGRALAEATVKPQAVKPKPPKAAKAARKKAQPARKIASEPAAPAVDPLSRDRDLFQRFNLPMPPLEIEAGDGGFDLPPKAKIEELWTFTQGDVKEPDGEAFEFAKKLYRNKKFGLSLKTIEIARRENPKSPYLPEMKLLEAFCYRALAEETKTESLFAKAEKILEELGAKREESPYPFESRIQLYFGQADYNKGKWLEAIQSLEAVASSAPKGDPNLPYIQILLADAYGKVDQPRRAERIYRFLYDRFPRHIVGKESRFRIASLLAQDQNYKRVTEEGEAAIRAFPDYEKKRAETLFQMGEANFWLGNYNAAEKYFKRFTRLSSASTDSALAWVRIGEISELVRGDLKGAREAYLQAKNGYPFSQGDLVATVRLARIDIKTEKEPGYIVNSLTGMLADQTIDGDLRRMAELTLVDYLILSGDVDQAVQISSAGLAHTDGKAYEAYTRAYVKSQFAKLEQLNGEKKYTEALALYDKERKWLDLNGADTYRSMADTYKGLGLYSTSNELMARYAREARDGRGLASAGEKKEISLAKARNSFATGNYRETLEFLPRENSGEILAMRAIAEKRLGSRRDAYIWAEKVLATNGKLPDAMVEEVAEILLDRDTDDLDFARMERHVASVSTLVDGELERLVYAGADALWYQKKHNEAVSRYRAALEKYPKGERADRARYNVGMSLLSLGNRAEAVKQLTEVANNSQSVWAESAKQELELVNWEKKYSSVLKTLPPSGLGISK